MNLSDDKILGAEDIPGRKSLCQSAEFSSGKGRPCLRRGSGEKHSARAIRQTLQRPTIDVDLNHWE